MLIWILLQLMFCDQWDVVFRDNLLYLYKNVLVIQLNTLQKEFWKDLEYLKKNRLLNRSIEQLLHTRSCFVVQTIEYRVCTLSVCLPCGVVTCRGSARFAHACTNTHQIGLVFSLVTLGSDVMGMADAHMIQYGAYHVNPSPEQTACKNIKVDAIHGRVEWSHQEVKRAFWIIH